MIGLAPPMWRTCWLIKHCHKTSFQLPATAASAHMHLPTCQPLWIIRAPANQLSWCNPRPKGKFFFIALYCKMTTIHQQGLKGFLINSSESKLPSSKASLTYFPFGKEIFDSATRSRHCELSGVRKVIRGHISVSTTERTSQVDPFTSLLFQTMFLGCFLAEQLRNKQIHPTQTLAGIFWSSRLNGPSPCLKTYLISLH